MRIGRTYTRNFDLDTRQHELLGIDLGEGIPRRSLILGFVLFGIWCGGALLLFGLPGDVTFSLYTLPPVLTTVYGSMHSARVDRRLNFTVWVLSLRYLMLGHRPIICGGRRAATRGEWIPRAGRWGRKAQAYAHLPIGAMMSAFLGERTQPQPMTGPVIRLDAKPRLYSPEATYKARVRHGETRANEKEDRS